MKTMMGPSLCGLFESFEHPQITVKGPSQRAIPLTQESGAARLRRGTGYLTGRRLRRHQRFRAYSTPGSSVNISVDAVGAGLDVNGQDFQAFDVTALAGHENEWPNRIVKAFTFVRDSEALPPANVPQAKGYLTGPQVRDAVDSFANDVIAAFNGANICISRIANNATNETPAPIPDTSLAAPLEWEYVVTGTFPKRVVDKYTSWPTPAIIVPKELKFLVESVPDGSTVILLSLQVFGAGDSLPKPASPCVTADPSATHSSSPVPANVSATPAKSPSPRP